MRVNNINKAKNDKYLIINLLTFIVVDHTIHPVLLNRNLNYFQ